MSTITSMQMAREIYQRIRGINELIRDAELQILSLNVARGSLIAERNTWHNTYTTCMTSVITSDITVQGMFRGNIAETLKTEFPEETRQMTLIGGGAVTAASSVNGQVRKLTQYIEDLEAEKAQLSAQLNGL